MTQEHESSQRSATSGRSESNLRPSSSQTRKSNDYRTSRTFILVIGGDIEGNTQSKLQEALIPGLTPSTQTLVLDLRAVDFLGITGRRILCRIERVARARGITLRLVTTDPELLRTLAASGLCTTCFESVSAAVDSAEPPPPGLPPILRGPR
ncbi:STAS domain-containing protein [Saccharopolyspora shandongensis]|uniref:STAS domain-containing protein n=1 Tax=Saccharopolyspora shandongensis TaxID=418495 RepID=UPI003408535B